MRPAAQAFRSMIRHLEPGLRERGFDKHGFAFSKIIDGNLAAVDFAKNPDSTPATYVFFVDLVVMSRFVFWFETGRVLKTKDIPRDYVAGHLWQRLGMMLEERAEWGWHIEDEQDAAPLADFFLEALDQYGLPFLAEWVHDARLIEGWRRGLDPRSGGDINHLLRLSVLAAAYDNRELAQRAIEKLREECRGHPCASRVEEHAEKLARWEPPYFARPRTTSPSPP
jgi:hypothetical protein